MYPSHTISCRATSHHTISHHPTSPNHIISYILSWPIPYIIMSYYIYQLLMAIEAAWGCLNIKMSSHQYRIPMFKIRRSHDRLIFNMGITIPGKDGLYIETGSTWPLLIYCYDNIWLKCNHGIDIQQLLSFSTHHDLIYGGGCYIIFIHFYMWWSLEMDALALLFHITTSVQNYCAFCIRLMTFWNQMDGVHRIQCIFLWFQWFALNLRHYVNIFIKFETPSCDSGIVGIRQIIDTFIMVN